MHGLLAFIFLLNFATTTLAFPTANTGFDFNDPEVLELLELVKRHAFNSSSEYERLKNYETLNKRQTVATYPYEQISVTGAHAFVAPGTGDQRGPCPALNALANHNYIQHDGVVGLVNVVTATVDVFGLGADTGLILSAYALITSGGLLSRTWSIGGLPPSNGGILGNLFAALIGRGKGLTNSHNKFETDASGFAGDYYLNNGDVNILPIAKFQKYLSWQNGVTDPNWNNENAVLHNHRRYSLELSINTNPYFFFGPFGMVVSNAGATFVPAMFSSYTPAYPKGKLEKRMLLDFFSVTENPVTKKLTYKKGYNRIPTNWWRRSHALPDYGLVLLSEDLIKMILVNPDIIKIGGNTGTVNSFAGVDLGDLTGGAYQLTDLTNPNKLVCFIFGLLLAAVPDLFQGGLLGGLLGAATDLIQMIIAPLMNPTCPGIQNFNSNLLDGFPGAGLGEDPNGRTVTEVENEAEVEEP